MHQVTIFDPEVVGGVALQEGEWGLEDEKEYIDGLGGWAPGLDPRVNHLKMLWRYIRTAETCPRSELWARAALHYARERLCRLIKPCHLMSN